jgi:hypothetical protein
MCLPGGDRREELVQRAALLGEHTLTIWMSSRVDQLAPIGGAKLEAALLRRGFAARASACEVRDADQLGLRNGTGS